MRKILFLLLTMTALFAEVKVGETFPSFVLVDQFDHNISVKKNTKVLMVSFQKGVSSEIQEFLKRQEKGFLEKNNALYLADISAMPSFLIRLFALPKMKKFNFKIALIYQENVADVLPRKEDKVTLIKLDEQKIVSIELVNPKELTQFIP